MVLRQRQFCDELSRLLLLVRFVLRSLCPLLLRLPMHCWALLRQLLLLLEFGAAHQLDYQRSATHQNGDLGIHVLVDRVCWIRPMQWTCSVRHVILS